LKEGYFYLVEGLGVEKGIGVGFGQVGVVLYQLSVVVLLYVQPLEAVDAK
jgi:hypothetical protein